MGVNIKPLLVREATSLESFSSKVVAIDAYNALYQFLSIIRGPDGRPLADSGGTVTSHLSGLLYRNVNYLSTGIKPIYVFDGRPPSLKSAEIERRRQTKRDAAIRYERALSDGDREAVRRYAQQTTSLKDSMVDNAKILLDLFGIPYVDAPSEGEATAAHLTRTGTAFAAASQDFDSILFGARQLVRNFTNSGRRKIPNRNAYVSVEPEVIDTRRSLDLLGLTREQMVDIGILIGTDFNPDGFRRIGPKTALKLISKHSRLEDIPGIGEQLERIDYARIRKIFLEPDVAGGDVPEAGEVDHEGIVAYLAERDFAPDRVRISMNRLRKAQERRNNNLDRWM